MTIQAIHALLDDVKDADPELIKMVKEYVTLAYDVGFRAGIERAIEIQTKSTEMILIGMSK